jgi:hypothetical protein
LKRIIKMGVLLSVLGLLVYVLPFDFPEGYEAVGKNGALIVFGIGWALSLGTLAFQLGIEKYREKE